MQNFFFNRSIERAVGIGCWPLAKKLKKDLGNTPPTWVGNLHDYRCRVWQQRLRTSPTSLSDHPDLALRLSRLRSQTILTTISDYPGGALDLVSLRS